MNPVRTCGGEVSRSTAWCAAGLTLNNRQHTGAMNNRCILKGFKAKGEIFLGFFLGIKG